MTGSYLKSSIGKKQLMAITGLAWCGFVLGHMAGNLLYLVGPDAFNAYGHGITHNKLIYYPIEIGLLVTFVLHVLFALSVIWDNAKARPIGYAVSQQGSDKTAATFASRTMKYTGFVILIFTVLHLITFRFGPYYPFTHQGEEIRDLALLMKEVFVNVGYFVWYIVALIALGLHLSHALWSACQTLGLIPPHREALLQRISWAYGFLVALGFMANPLYIFLVQRG